MRKHTHKKDAPGMRGYRPRDKDGELERKRKDTLVGTIEKKYKIKLPLRTDARLETAMKKMKAPSLKALVKKAKKKGRP